MVYHKNKNSNNPFMLRFHAFTSKMFGVHIQILQPLTRLITMTMFENIYYAVIMYGLDYIAHRILHIMSNAVLPSLWKLFWLHLLQQVNNHFTVSQQQITDHCEEPL